MSNIKFTSENLSDVLRVQGVDAKGYGKIPKSVMIDQRLTPDAKLIYSYFCSFAGAGDCAFPSQSKIRYDLRIKDPKTFRKHLDYLEKYGYIIVTQERGEKGKFNHNVYTLVSNPVETIETEESHPLGKISATEKIRYGKNPLRKNSTTTNNISFTNNSIFKNNNKKEKIVVDENTEKIVSEFKKQYKANLNKELAQKLINEKGEKCIEECVDVYRHYMAGRNIRNIAGDFYTFCKQGYELPVTQNLKQSHENFEQREHEEGEFERYYANVKR